MQANISVKWGGKNDHSIMAFASLAKHDADNMFKTKWNYDVKSSCNKSADSDATIAAPRTRIYSWIRRQLPSASCGMDLARSNSARRTFTI